MCLTLTLLNSRVKLFLCGFSGVGKTTLLGSLGVTSRIARLFRREGQRADPENMRERTPGIDIKTVTLEGDAEFSVWDYAGQVEYYLVRRLVLT